MFGFLAEIAGAIWTGIKGLWTMCKKIIKASINFVHDLVDGLFEILEDIFGDDVPSSVDESHVKPFIGDMDKLTQNAPIKDCNLFGQKKKNYIKGAYDTRTGKIIKPTYVAGDKVDQETIDAMDDEPIIIVG